MFANNSAHDEAYMNKYNTIIKSSPFIISLVYVLVGAIWIQYSDQIVLSMIQDPETLTRIQSLKGWLYVILSGALIFFLVYQSNDMIEGLVNDVKRNSKKFESTFNHAPVAIAHHEPNENWILVNKAMCSLLGYSKEEILKLDFKTIIHPDDLERGRQLDKKLLSGKISSYKTEKKYRRKDKTVFTGRVTKAAVFDKNQKPQYLIAIIEDVSRQKEYEFKLKESLKEKEDLLAEVHHRVKNNIALMHALLELQLMHGQNSNTEQILEQYKTRLQTLSLIYENFSGSESLPLVSFDRFLNEQVQLMMNESINTEQDLHYDVNIEEVQINVNQAIPVGLVSNEILMNTKKYHFENTSNPFIKVDLKQFGEIIELKVETNGKGNDDLLDLSDPDSLDSRIIAALTKQIEGQVTCFSDEKLYSYKLTFKKGEWRGAASYKQPEKMS